MFLLIPLIIVFLLLAYIYLNDVSSFIQGLVYSICIFIVAISLYIYIKIKKDMKQHEINLLEAELSTLEKQLKTLEDDKQRNTIQRKINSIKNELNSQLQQ